MEQSAGSAAEPGLRRTPAGALLLAVILAGCFIRYGVINPGQNYQLDFRAFYATGRALHLGINPYDLEAKQQVINPQLPGKQHLMGFANPPPTLPLMYLVALLPLPGAQIAWAWFQLLLVLAGMLLLCRAVQAQFGSAVSLLIAVPYWLSYPLHSLFRWGQIDGLRVALVALAVFLLMRRRYVTAGVAVGLAALAKVYPVAYLWVFMLRREWKALIAGCVTIGVLLGISVAALGPAARTRYLSNNSDEFGKVDWVISPQNMSMVGFMHRAFVNNEQGTEASRAWINLGPRFALAASITGNLLLIAITSVWILRRRLELESGEAVAALVPVVLLVELNAWPHHCVSMLIPIALIVGLIGHQPRIGLFDALWVGAIVFLYTFCPVHQFDVGLPKQIEHLVGPTTTYAMLLAWLFMLVRYPVLKRRLVPATSL
jgi:hypothetical protein